MFGICPEAVFRRPAGAWPCSDLVEDPCLEDATDGVRLMLAARCPFDKSLSGAVDVCESNLAKDQYVLVV